MSVLGTLVVAQLAEAFHLSLAQHLVQNQLHQLAKKENLETELEFRLLRSCGMTAAASL